MKNIHDMIYDVRLEWKYIKFKKLFSRTSWLLPPEHEMSPDSQRSLDDLNRKRQGLQKSISQTFAPFKDVCRDCGGVCCYGHGSFYRAIDYWMQRRNGNVPLPSYAGEKEVRITPQRLYSKLCRFLVTSGGSYDYIKENMKDKERVRANSSRFPVAVSMFPIGRSFASSGCARRSGRLRISVAGPDTSSS